MFEGFIPKDFDSGATYLTFGAVAYVLLKLLERYSGSEKFYKNRLTLETKRADTAEKKLVASEAQRRTLKEQLEKERNSKR